MGDGIGSHDEKPVFVPKSVIGDRLRLRVIHETSEFKRCEIIDILEAGSERKEAPCPYFAACGGCTLQQMQDATYQQFKQKIASNAMRQAGFEAESVNTVFLPPASRRRAEFKLLKEHGRFHLAYMGNRSHNKVAIANCLILEPVLQKILPLLQDLVGNLTFVKDIESVSVTNADSGIEVVLELVRTANSKNLQNNEAELRHLVDTLKLVRLSVTDSRLVPVFVVESGYLTMRLGEIDMPLPQDAFLQATKQGQKLLTEFAEKSVKGSKRTLDLFCGIGTYSVALATRTSTVHAVDDHFVMITNLRHAARTHNMRLTTEKRNLFVNPFTTQELKGFDAVIINPPRAGAKAQCEELAKSDIKNVVMISCNPASFVRDAKVLKNAGFTLKNVLAIDQFVWSPHLELVANFSR